jgi:hypothetical protein
MNQSRTKKNGASGRAGKVILGLVLGAGAGYLVSYVAGSAGSQCMILCNQEVAIPYFAAMGILVAWR